MAAKTASVNINIVANAAKAAAGFKDAADAGAEFAKALGKAADKVEKDLEQTGKMADLLAKKLGPQFKTVAGEGIDDIARRMNKAGLTFEQLDGNIDDITASFRRMEAQAEETARATDRIADRTNRASDVTRSYAGNAIGDFAQMTTGLGGVGEAIGQMTEGLLGGEIAFKQLAVAGAGMAGVALASFAVNEIMKKNAEIAARTKQYMDDLAAATADSTLSSAEMARNLAAEWAKTGKVMARVKLPLAEDMPQNLDVPGFIQDITGRLDELGVTAESFAKLVVSTPRQLQMYRDAFIQTGMTVEDTDWLLGAATETQNDYNTQLANSEMISRIFAGTTDEANKAIEKQVGALELLNAEWDYYWGLWDKQDLTRSTWETLFWTDSETEDKIRQVAQFVEKMTGLPPDIMSRLTPMIQQGELDKVWSLLDAYSRLADLFKTGVLRPSAIPGGVPVVPGGMRGYATGTMSAQRGLALVGERGPELIDFGGGERVYNAQQTSSMVGQPTSITVNLPAGANGDDVVRALQNWTRNNGALPIPVTSTVIR